MKKMRLNKTIFAKHVEQESANIMTSKAAPRARTTLVLARDRRVSGSAPRPSQLHQMSAPTYFQTANRLLSHPTNKATLPPTKSQSFTQSAMCHEIKAFFYFGAKCVDTATTVDRRKRKSESVPPHTARNEPHRIRALEQCSDLRVY